MTGLNLRPWVNVGALTAIVLGCGWPAIGRGADVIDVPLYYDVLGGADLQVPQGKTVESELKKLTKLVNLLFERSNANVEFATVDNSIRQLGGNMSKLDKAQRDALLDDGVKRLKDEKGDKGLLVVLAQQTNKEKASVLGVCFQNTPVSIVTARSVAGIDDTTAHEIGHSLTLGHHTDRSNLMWEDSGNTDTKLVDEQVAAMRKAALIRGKVKAKAMLDSPAQNKPQAFGMISDPGQLLAAAPSFQNVFRASLRAFGDESAYEVQLDLAGLVPSTGAAASYRLLFDVDTRDDTGVLVDGQPGIDQILKVDLTDAGAPSYALENPVTMSAVSLVGTMTRRLEFQDAEEGTPEFAEPHHDDFEIMLPKSLLPLSGGRFFEIPVLASAGGTTTDSFELDFDLQFELQGPQLDCNVGLVRPDARTVQLTGANYAPDSIVDVYAADSLLQTVQADASGGFFTSLELPAFALDGGLLYIRAYQQSTTNYGFTAVHTVPEPGAACLILACVALLGTRAFFGLAYQ